MSELNPINGESLNLTTENIQKLKELFPEVLTEDQIDFDKLRLVLGEEVNDQHEKYSFTWNGKQKAIKLAQQPSTGTLRPNKEKSKNWDTTDNIYIEGDNLEGLKLLQKSYAGKIKVIYIDPPYNTGNDFVYKDNFVNNLDNYHYQTGQVSEKGQKLSTNVESSGRFHSDWLTMMYPRMKLARNLLSEDGVIFISIDDHEQHNLRKICDELFGENNFIANIAHKNRAGISNDKIISSNHNFILFYAKDINKIEENRKEYGILRTAVDFKSYNKDDNDGRGPYKLNPVTGPGGARKGNPHYSVLGITNFWRYGKERMKKLVEEKKVIRINDSIYQKTYKREMEGKKKGGTTWWDEVGTTSHGTKEIKELFDNNTVFDHPKPESLLEYIINYIDNSDKSYTVLDFFSGSSSTAAATMRMNSKDNGDRKYIMVQLPEETTQTSIAHELGYKNITDIAIERINRSGNKLLDENPELKNELDIGFKYFKLDKSNIKKWNIDSKNIEESLFSMKNNFVEGRSHTDIVFEILLKLGLDLNTPFTEVTVDESTVYDIAFGNVYVVLGENITQEVAKFITDKQKVYENENPSVVFNDNGFVNDNEKLNSIEILKNNGFNGDQLMSI